MYFKKQTNPKGVQKEETLGDYPVGTPTPPGAHTHPASQINDSTTVGRNLVKLADPSAIRFLRINADNTVSELTAADFRTAVGAGTSNLAIGITAGTACEGNDSRLSDSRTPTAHILDGALHTVTGKTTGHFLKALSATTFGFAAHGLSASDVGALPTSTVHNDLGGRDAVACHPADAIVATPYGTLSTITVEDQIYEHEDDLQAIRTMHSDVHFTSGFLSRTDNTFGLSTRTFTVTPVSTDFEIYLDAVKYVKTGGASCSTTFGTEIGKHFIYFDATATLQNSVTPWVLVNGLATTSIAWWNGSAARIVDERHSAQRNLAAHDYLHNTRGTAYASGLDLTYPTTANDGILQIETGIIWDEDLKHETGQQKRCVIWYQTAGGAWTWELGTDNGGFDRPYKWNAGSSRLQFPDLDNAYTLTDVTTNRYQKLWVYAVPDVTPGDARPIYIIVPAIDNSYATPAQARAEPEPLVRDLIYPEMKLIYSLIFQGNGDFLESSDYRTVSSLPSSTSTTIQHNNTTEKQGGTAGEYYHLTSSQATVATQAATSSLNGYMTATYAAKVDQFTTTATKIYTFPSVSCTLPRVDGSNSFLDVQTIYGFGNGITNAVNGEIRLGNTAAYRGELAMDALTGNTTLYINNTYNSTGAAIKLRTRTAGTPVDCLTLMESGSLCGTDFGLVSGKVYKVNTVQVLGQQGAVVADATDNASAITQLNLLLSRVRTHGIIAT